MSHETGRQLRAREIGLRSRLRCAVMGAPSPLPHGSARVRAHPPPWLACHCYCHAMQCLLRVSGNVQTNRSMKETIWDSEWNYEDRAFSTRKTEVYPKFWCKMFGHSG